MPPTVNYRIYRIPAFEPDGYPLEFVRASPSAEPERVPAQKRQVTVHDSLLWCRSVTIGLCMRVRGEDAGITWRSS